MTRGFLKTMIRPLQTFLRMEASSGILLFSGALAAVVWANGDEASYRAAFETARALTVASLDVTLSLRVLVNDALMTLFFFVVGMEIKREILLGELRSVRRALLPAIGAAGGMAVPALVFVLANRGGATRGWGIPTATDIAFSIGVLTLLKDRVPRGLIVFVTALAIFDDIGGILVIAFFYGHGLQVAWLGAAAVLAAVCFLLGRARVRSLLAWTVVGGALAVALHQGGIHSTIAGVIAGLAVPARCRDVHAEPPLDRFVRLLHPWVAYGIVPLFALANAGVSIGAVGMRGFAAPVTLGAALGLFAGKQAGIFGATMIAVRAGVAPMPGDATPAQLWGASVVAGIGLTVALFIAALAFGHDAQLLDEARLGILLGSLASGLAGYAVLRAVGTPVAPGEALDAGE